jgi:hypothetical protein
MMSIANKPQQRPRSLIAAILLIPCGVALVLALFAWPAARLGPRDLPLGVAGPPQALAPLEQRLAERGNAFAIHRYADEAAARDAIKAREVYGAIVVSPDGPLVFTASAASPLVAQLLQQAIVASPAPAGGTAAPARVVDVVPTDADDPRGVAFGTLLLPIVLAGLLAGVAMWSVTHSAAGRLGGLIGVSALVGLVTDGIAQGWLGIIGGSWLANAGALALTVLAIGSFVTGCGALLGQAGLVLGAALMMFIGNPFSGIASAPEMLPRPVGAIGQLLPPGAGGNLLRSTAFFDGGGAASHLVVVGLWAIAGLALVWAGSLRYQRTAVRVPVGKAAVTS